MANEDQSEIEAKLAEMASPKTQTLPGGRAALPEGSLSKPYLGPQGDEHRDPPEGGLTPVAPAPVVAREVAPAGAPWRADPQMQMRCVGKRDAFAEGSIIRKSVGKSEIILIRTGETVRAFGARCPHAGAPLDGGALCNGKLICPWHKAAFRVSDGVVLEPPALDGLLRFETQLDGDDVLVATEPLREERPQPRADIRRIAIIGSGAAGIAACAELRRRGFDGRMSLIGPESARPYDRTALSKFVLAGDMKPDEVPSLREPAWFARNGIDTIPLSVLRVEVEHRRLQLSDGTSFLYDAALLAVGAVARRPDIPGITLRGVYTLRGLADAAAIAAAARRDAHAVIMGSSFIGLEAASALRKAGLRVTVVAPDAIPFAKQFGPEIGGMMRRLHEANGVVFRLGSTIEAVEGTDAVACVRLEGGEILPTDFLLVGVGVEPASKALPGIPTGPDGAVGVDTSFRLADGLYAAGDCAEFPYAGHAVRIEHWRLAQQHGCRAAAAMLGEAPSFDGVPFFWTYHYGRRFEYLGHARAWDKLHIEGDIERQDFVALQVQDDAVVGVIACQRERVTAALIDRMRERLPFAEALSAMKSA